MTPTSVATNPNKALPLLTAAQRATLSTIVLTTITCLLKARGNRGPLPAKDLLQHEFVRVAARKYSVDDNGTVFNRKTGHVLRPVAHDGYVAIKVHDKGARRNVLVHQVVAYVRHGDVMFEGHRCVVHKDGNKTNNRPDNLVLSTRQHVAEARANVQARVVIDEAHHDVSLRELERETGVNRGNVWRRRNAPVLRGPDQDDVKPPYVPFTQGELARNHDNLEWLQKQLTLLLINNWDWSIDELLGVIRRVVDGACLAHGALNTWAANAGQGD